MAVTFAVLKVGFRRASTWPLRTISPRFASMLAMMASSKGCSWMLGLSAVSLPRADTILSTWITPLATRRETTSTNTSRLVIRASAGGRVAMMAAEGLSNSSRAGGLAVWSSPLMPGDLG